jgi:pimeloyl-[acyl-carrier protein] methyl ester esterase
MRNSYAVTSLSLPELQVQGKGEHTGGGQGAAAPISAYAGAVVRRLERFDEPSCIIGWSTGAMVAIEAAANCAEKVAGLVLLSATARFCAEVPAKDASSGEYSAGVKPAALRAMIRKLKRSPEGVIADFLMQAVFPMTIPMDELVCRTQNALRPGKDSLVDGLEYLARADLRGCLRSITPPCLVIHGRQDRIVPWRAAMFLGSNLPVSNVELLPSSGHLLIEQGGKDLIHLTAQFVESLR